MYKFQKSSNFFQYYLTKRCELCEKFGRKYLGTIFLTKNNIVFDLKLNFQKFNYSKF